MKLRLLVVDDNTQFLLAACGLFEREGITVVGVASSSAEALARYEELRPGVTLVDIDLGQESGLDLARRLAEDGGGPKVILISAYPEDDVVDLIEGMPVIGFLPKSRLSGRAILDLLGGADDGG